MSQKTGRFFLVGGMRKHESEMAANVLDLSALQPKPVTPTPTPITGVK